MVDQDTFIHLFAGGVGGTAGAIVTCPLEVVKTRLQSSNSGFDTSIKVQGVATTSHGRSSSCKTNKTKNWSRMNRVTIRPVFGSQFSANLLNGGHGCFGSTTPILYSTQSQPCRPVKTKLNSFPDRTNKLVHSTVLKQAVHTSSVPQHPPIKKTLSAWACIKHIRSHEGLRGLFRGLGPNLVGVAPSRAIYFWTYSTTKQNLNSKLPPFHRESPFVHMVSAAAAGFISSCFTNPIWLVKTRLQLNRSGDGFFAVGRTIYLEQAKYGWWRGLAGFWKGVTASWYGISETIFHFVIYEHLKETFTDHRKGEKSMLDFAVYMLCGATSKTCATCLCYPHEVARTRLRESGDKYRSFWQTILVVYREEGRRGLYRGLATQLIRQIPNTAIMMCTYEATVYMLTNYLRERRKNNKVNMDAMANKSSHSQ